MQFFMGLILVGSVNSPVHALELFGYEIGLGGISKVNQKNSDTIEDIPDPVPYIAEIQVANDELRDKLENASILLAKQETPPSGTIGLITRIRQDRNQLIAALYKTAHYGATVAITINGKPFDQIPLTTDLMHNGPAKVIITIQPGPVFTFAKSSVKTTNGMHLLPSDYGLKQGTPAFSNLVLDAEDKVLRNYRNKGFPFVEIKQRQLEADHKTKQLSVLIEVTPGQQARFGTVSVRGAKTVNTDFIIRQAHIPHGKSYNPKDIQDATKRLRGLNVFSSVIIEPAKQLTANGTLPIQITVNESKHRTIGVGATADTLDGLGFSGFWAHRNVLGQAENLRVEASVARIGKNDLNLLDYRGALIFNKKGIFDFANVFDAQIALDVTNPDAYQKQALTAEIGFTRTFSKILSARAGLKLEYARVKESDGKKTQGFLLSAPLELTYDTRDNILNPAKGAYIALKTEPTASLRNDTKFLKSSGSISLYRALDEGQRFILAGRFAAGSIVGAEKADIPTDHLFYAGGGGSIRGYAYQAAGPRSTTNRPSGGRSFAEISIEARLRITESIGMAIFMDRGAAFNDIVPGRDGEWYTGIGAGLRYFTPIGPLRVDIAIPLNHITGEPNYGIYLGLGQAF